MSKLYSFLLGLGAALLLGNPAAAQNKGGVPPVRTCGTQAADAQQQALLQRLLPGYNPAKAPETTTPRTFRQTATVYTLPVIVHVIHNGEAVGAGSNLSQAQINSQIDVLNEDYRNLNPDGATVVPAAFQGVRGDVQLQFVMVTRDPQGNPLPEPGIDRVNRSTAGFTAPPYGGTNGNPNTDYIDGTIKPQTIWNPEQYINIWVMDMSASGLLGYAQFPDNTAGLGGLSPLGGAANTDGVVILNVAFGSRAKAPGGNYGSASNPYDKGRTLTHELGHFFSLRHVWGDSGCGNDYVPDTPTQQTYNYNCPTFPHVTCANGPNGDQFMNYMDYVNDACMAMFSGGQVSRVQAVMAVGTPRRTNLATSPALCSSAVAASIGGGGSLCAGSTISLSASGPAGASYVWTGPNNFSSSAQNPTLANATAAMSGTYSVTVSVAGSCPQPSVRSTTVTVNNVPPTPSLTSSAATVCAGTSVTLAAASVVVPSPLPSEDFNGSAPGWTLSNAGAASTAWQYATAPYSYASTYLTLSNFSIDGTRFALANSDAGGNNSLTNTTLTSPSFSTVGHSSLQLVFQQVFRYQAGDLAVVEASTNGSTWTRVAAYTSTQGTPAAPVTTTLNLAAYANQPSVQVRFRYNTSWAYYWAIDNVRLVDPTPAPVYAWTVVSGNGGLPATTNTPSLVATPTSSAVYRLTVSYPNNPCTSSATVAVAVSNAAVWNGTAGDGNWFNAANWTGCVPTRFTDATIPAGLASYPTIGTGTAEVRSLVQQGSLSISGGQFNIFGDFTGAGAFSHTGGQVVAMATGAQALRAGTYYDLAIAGTGTKSLPASTVNSRLVMSGSVLNATGTITLAPTATLVNESDASYVLGRVQTTHTVGTSPDALGNLGATIAASFAPGTTTVVRVTGLPQGTGADQSISRYYDIQAANTRGLQGATLGLAYLPHELNNLSESQLATFKSVNGGATWTNEGVTSRDATAKTVSRSYVTSLNGRWTLAAATSALASGGVAPSIQAFPVPFDANGLSVQLTTTTPGPVTVQLYDMAGRRVIDQAIANVELGTSTVSLLGSGQLAAGKYVLRVQQGSQNVTMNVVHL